MLGVQVLQVDLTAKLITGKVAYSKTNYSGIDGHILSHISFRFSGLPCKAFSGHPFLSPLIFFIKILEISPIFPELAYRYKNHHADKVMLQECRSTCTSMILETREVQKEPPRRT